MNADSVDSLPAGTSDETVADMLKSVRGIGQWTVDMLLMFQLKRPNILPVGDLGIRKGAALHFHGKLTKKLPNADELLELTRAWEPYRSVGSWLMYRIQDAPKEAAQSAASAKIPLVTEATNSQKRKRLSTTTAPVVNKKRK